MFRNELFKHQRDGEFVGLEVSGPFLHLQVTGQDAKHFNVLIEQFHSRLVEG